MRVVLSIGAFLWGTLAFGASPQPVEVMRGVAFSAPLASDRVLYREGNVVVMRTPAAKASDFDDLYVVDLTGRIDLPAGIELLGTLVDFEPAHFAVMHLTVDAAETIAAQLHGEGHACGVLTKLSGRPISLMAATTPVPLIAAGVRDARVENVVQKVLATNIKASIEELSAIYTRHHQSATGGDIATLLAAKYETLRMGRADVTISTYDHGRATPQDSLVVRIEGATRPNELIILGSHLDSINRQTSGGRSPGADDNASGTATNLEIFRLLMEEGIRPERTLEIHAYAAEEAGLVGSQDVANDYSDRGLNVVAMMQFDMNSWKAAGAADKIWFVTTDTLDGFTNQLVQLAGTYTGVVTAKAPLFAGSSDHRSWKRAGFATAFPFENPSSYNPNIHTSNDTMANAAAFDQAAAFGKLGVAYVMHFGGLN